MAEKVEVVIKIPKYYLTHPQDYSCLAECVRRGVPLPKGHGRLIDADCLKNSIHNFFYGHYSADERDIQAYINAAKTRIEADKEQTL